MVNFSAKLTKAAHIVGNYAVNSRYDLSFVVEYADWIIKRIGMTIVEKLNKKKLLRSRITATHIGIKNHIVHFGSINTFIRKDSFCKKRPGNKIVLTWFHLREGDEHYIRALADDYALVDRIHTACQKTKRELISCGIPDGKISVIPLGVDLKNFHPVLNDVQKELRDNLGIPKDKIVIGSFQKDGVGWDLGMKPKLIKGPDLFVEVVLNLAKQFPVFVLLVGPARGYVETQLKKAGISFFSVGHLKHYEDISAYYRMLDFYLITSRVEGGPQQILEAWASGIPVVATNVGLIPDIAQHEKTVLLSTVGSVEEMIGQCMKLINNNSIKASLKSKALEEVEKYSWENIADRYYHEIYQEFI